jgi:hypothetical protein
MHNNVEELFSMLGAKVKRPPNKRTPCDICGSVYEDDSDYNECVKHCNLMVKSYMHNRKINRQQAITQFRLEMI